MMLQQKTLSGINEVLPSFNLESAIEDFALSMRATALSPRTVYNHAWILRKFTRFVGEMGFPQAVSGITTEHIRHWLAHCSEREKALSVVKYYNVLRAFWGYLVKEGEVRENPLDRIEAPRPDVQIVQIYSEAEFKALYSRAAAQYKAALALLYATGMRSFELCSLRLQDVDLATGIIRVMGKGRKERRVDAGPRAMLILRRYLRARERAAQGRTLRPDEPLLLNLKGRPMQPHGLWQALKRLAQAAGIKGARLHRFRNTFAEMFLENGGSDGALQDILGHSSPVSTRVYTRSRAQQRALDQQRRFNPFERLTLPGRSPL